MWRILAPLAVLVLVVVAAATAGRAGPRAEVVILDGGDVNTLDPHRMSWLHDLRLAGALWEGLVRANPDDPAFAPEPAAAESWTVSEDGRRYTFTLRPGLRWSNGEPLTAEDFRRTWLRAILPETGGDYLSLFGLIRGVREFLAWREARVEAFLREAPDEADARQTAAESLWAETVDAYGRMVGARAEDDRTLVVELARPAPYFLEVLAYEVAVPLYMPVVERFQRVDGRTGRLRVESGWTKPGLLVSNGPYRLEAWLFKREMRLARNERYWNAVKVAVGSIALPSIADPAAVLVAGMTGSADWVTSVNADARRDLVSAKRAFLKEHESEVESMRARGMGPLAIDRSLPADPRNRVHVFPAFGTFFLNLNCSASLADGRKNPLADARVRRALALAVDKDAVAALRGIGEPVARSLVPPGSLAGYEPPEAPGRDVDAARQALMDAGYLHGDQVPTLEVLFTKDGGHDQVMQAIARGWQRDLGIRIELRQKERKAFREDLKRGNYMISTANWFGDYGDPTTFLETSRSRDGNNDRRYAGAEFDALLDRAAEERDAAARLGLLREAEGILVTRDFPFIPVVHECTVTLFDAHRLEGITDHPRQKQQLGRLRLVEMEGVMGRGSPGAPGSRGAR